MTYLTDPTARRLHAFLRRWLQEHPSWARSSSGWYYHPRTAGEIASELLQDAEFCEVRLATWLKSPDGVLIQAVVGWALPQPYGAEFKVLVDAISLAAQARQNNDRLLAGGLTVAVGAMVGLLMLSAHASQGSTLA